MVKNPPVNTGDERLWFNPRWEAPAEEGMAVHSSVLAWRILWTEEPGGLQSIVAKKLDTTERLSTHARDSFL